MVGVKVNLGIKSYPIEIGKDILLQTDFKKFGTGKYAIITDSNVRKLYGEDLLNLLKKQGLDAKLLDFPAGEKSKIPETAIYFGRELAKNNFDRNSIIIALGGGVTGDLAGFVASFYKRGIEYIQAPTTLLAMTDSSVGGKTGVDIPEGKNIVGYFHQPKAVITDIDTLKTLPQREIKNGFAEIIKYAVIRDEELFEFLEENCLSLKLEGYEKIIRRACEIKAEIVEKDEREKELRKILNYGHTIGHAIETAENYKISHGEAVGLGMVYEGMISVKLGLLSEKEIKRQNQLIKSFGLSVVYKGDVDRLIEIMRRDKKNKSGEIHFILPIKIGKVKEKDGQISFPVEESIIKECLKW